MIDFTTLFEVYHSQHYKSEIYKKTMTNLSAARKVRKKITQRAILLTYYDATLLVELCKCRMADLTDP